MIQTSFTYKDNLKIHSLMVIVPHEDDEVNNAGAAIYSAIKEGMDVKVVFMTNGDWMYPAFVRYNEAIRSLTYLGVPEGNIIFLGFPDGGTSGERAVYLHGLDKPVDAAGRKETYGVGTHQDYHFSKYGQHQEYTWKGLLDDMEDVILSFRPDALMVTDFDYHGDHRMLSIAFEKVMGRILNTPGNTYHPLVFKSFAYATSYVSYKDFYDRHFLSSRVYRKEMRYLDCETDNPVYEWNQRVRFPVDVACRGPKLLNNVLYKALICHLSQKNIEHVRQVFNSDLIFWERRTNNLAYEGKTTVSSGNGDYLHDFQLMNTRHINESKPPMEEYLWTPNDSEKWCRIDFNEPKHIESVALYGNIDDDSRILKGQLSFSNGFRCDVGELKKQGHETLVTFAPQDNVRWIRFTILKTKGEKAGLAEWEILKSPERPYQLLKICVDDNFAYNWYVYPGEEPIVSCYSCGISGDFQWYINGEPSALDRINKMILSLKGTIVLRVESKENPEIWDEITVSPATAGYRMKIGMVKNLDKLGVWWEHQMEKTPHHKLKKVKTEEEYRKL
ncbi:PIG-L family deacetylase [uncultured Dialister sp.]|uniref:PIG-L family deacetylase n=1 Tax=uncultured Dialister sp. TaxID=278064 RepID=UPI0025F5D71D|nr:PIG-L family deacetylase [uncultured Dialister sp.]